MTSTGRSSPAAFWSSTAPGRLPARTYPSRSPPTRGGLLTEDSEIIVGGIHVVKVIKSDADRARYLGRPAAQSRALISRLLIGMGFAANFERPAAETWRDGTRNGVFSGHCFDVRHLGSRA